MQGDGDDVANDDDADDIDFADDEGVVSSGDDDDNDNEDFASRDDEVLQSAPVPSVPPVRSTRSSKVSAPPVPVAAPASPVPSPAVSSPTPMDTSTHFHSGLREPPSGSWKGCLTAHIRLIPILVLKNILLVL